MYWKNKPSVKNSWAYQDLFRTKRDAREKQIPHTIKPTYVWSLKTSHCPVTGVELDYDADADNDRSATIVMLNPSAGYVPGNVRIVSWKAARAEGY